MIISKEYAKIIFSLIILMSLTFWSFPSSALADDHEKGHSDSRQYEIRKEHDDEDDKEFDEKDDDKLEGSKEDDGEGVTGQLALWLLIAANLNVVLSLAIKGVNRFFLSGLKTKSLISKFNQLQKKHLMRFHYILNPLALCIAIFHFIFSTCRTSAVPEWGLILLLMITVLGLMLKFKVSPKGIRRLVHRRAGFC